MVKTAIATVINYEKNWFKDYWRVNVITAKKFDQQISLTEFNSLINKYLQIFHAALDLKELYPRKSITTVYQRQKKPERNIVTIILS